MCIQQHIIPMSEFAQGMFKTDRSFAKRVRGFEQFFGKVDIDTLAVMAQASFFCWFEVEYKQDYTNVCRAIGMGRPTSLYLCRQINPERWIEMNTYIVGVQRWLGIKHPLPCQLSDIKLKQVGQWLGDHNALKKALAELFVCHLVFDLLHLSLQARICRGNSTMFSELQQKGRKPSSVIFSTVCQHRREASSTGSMTEQNRTAPL